MATALFPLDVAFVPKAIELLLLDCAPAPTDTEYCPEAVDALSATPVLEYSAVVPKTRAP